MLMILIRGWPVYRVHWPVPYPSHSHWLACGAKLQFMRLRWCLVWDSFFPPFTQLTPVWDLNRRPRNATFEVTLLPCGLAFPRSACEAHRGG